MARDEVITLPAQRGVRSLVWAGDELIDWCAGEIRYRLDGTLHDPCINYAYSFDSAVASPSGRFAVIYKRLGTKGVILDQTRKWKELREINRSYYHAEVYDYPVALLRLPDGREVIAHCPEHYNRLEIEDLETGERLTQHADRKPSDFFYSGLRANASGTWLISAGWFWHPIEEVAAIDIRAGLADPLALDKPTLMLPGLQINSAEFASDARVVLWSSTDGEEMSDDPPGEQEMLANTVGVYDFAQAKLISRAKVEPLGMLMPFGDEHVIGFHEHPKLVHLATGRVENRWDEIDSGNQTSCISFNERVRTIATDPNNRRFAVANENRIQVVQL